MPYDTIWNPGADQATAIAFTRDVHVNGQPVPAGKYSLWVVPGPARWTMIFSTAADVYHTPYPGQARDALRLEATTEPGPHMETLAFYFPVVEAKEAVLRLHWGEVIVPLSIRVRRPRTDGLSAAGFSAAFAPLATPPTAAPRGPGGGRAWP